jgi:UDP-glucuronate 4-epimerase
MKYLVTGAAGFIGYHVSKMLLDLGHEVLGLDNLNEYYDSNLKKARINLLEEKNNFHFLKMDLCNQIGVADLFKNEKFDRVIHLAAQAGVRYSVKNPQAYVDGNITGFLNVLEGCRYSNVPHLVFASTSSVYGANTKMPFSVHDNVDHPISFYAATKKANELMAHCYAHLYGLPVTGLRFFTVYGPWGRPDMALFIFTKSIVEGKPIDVFNNGKMKRDFTYVDDIANGVVKVSDKIPTENKDWDSDNPDPATSAAPYRIYNIGNNQPIDLNFFINCIENELGKKAKRNMLPMQQGDVAMTFADIEDLKTDVGFMPATPVDIGVQQFVSWYRQYYKI